LGTADVVQFSRNEFDKLVTLIFSTTIFGWSVGEDLYVVPNDGRSVLQTDHHEVIHVCFRVEDDLEDFVKGMDARGFVLPDVVPDATFKQPSWMKDVMANRRWSRPRADRAIDQKRRRSVAGIRRHEIRRLNDI